MNSVFSEIKQLLENLSEKEEAHDPSTPSERLTTIYDNNNRSPEIQKLVANNPNIHTSLMKEVFSKYPLHAVFNPIIDLMHLENPDFGSEFPREYALAHVVHGTANHIENRVLSHPNERVRGFTAEFLHNPRKHTEYFDILAKDPSTFVRGLAASNRDLITPTLSEIFSKDENPFIRKGLAGNTSTDLEVLNKLIKDPDPTVRKSARNSIKSLTRSNK